MPQLIHWSASLLVAVVIAAPLVFAGAAAQDSAPAVNPRAAVLADFQKRIDDYMALHKKVEKGPAEQKETKDPADIRRAQTLLAERIRTARTDAKQGDIFTPEIRAEFKRLMYPELKGQTGRDTKAIIKEDAPAKMRPKVNASYPEGQPLPTVPANLLGNLPRLPEDLEYRIVGKDLILRDVDANLIVDFMPNAIM